MLVWSTKAEKMPCTEPATAGSADESPAAGCRPAAARAAPASPFCTCSSAASRVVPGTSSMARSRPALASAGRSSISGTDADLDDLRPGRLVVGEDGAEDDDEEQREQDREEQADLVPVEALEHGRGQAGERPHVRYSRPVSSRNTSSSVAPRTCRPGQRVGLGQRGEHRGRAAGGDDGGHRILARLVDAVDRPGGVRPRPHRPPPRSGPARPGRGRVRPALPACRILPLSMIATRSHRFLGLVHVVGGQHHGLAAFVDGPQHIPQVAPRLRIQRRGRFVEENDLRVVDQARRRSTAAAPGRRTASRPGCRLVGERRPARASRRPAGRAAVERGEGGQLLPGGQPLEERRRLQLHAEPLQQVGVSRPDRLAEHGHAAGVGLPQALDDLQQRGLAGAVGSEDPEELAVPDGQRDVVDRSERSVSLDDVRDDDGVRHPPTR